MDKFKNSIETLWQLGTQIRLMVVLNDTIKEHEFLLKKVRFTDPFYVQMPFLNCISGVAWNNMTLLTASFLDEFNNEFTEGRHPLYANRIKSLKERLKPVRKRISKWKDIKRFRNTLLAHGYRINGESIFSVDVPNQHFKIPHTNSEKQLLMELITIILNCIAKEFPEVIEQIGMNSKIIDKLSFEYQEVDVAKEVRSLREEINLPLNPM